MFVNAMVSFLSITGNSEKDLKIYEASQNSTEKAAWNLYFSSETWYGLPLHELRMFCVFGLELTLP